jgi:ASC-1-like (ASCH) protein
MQSQSREVPQTSVRTMHLRRPYLDRIASQAKTVEVRVAAESRRDLAPGQLIRFEAGEASVLTRIVRVGRYASFSDMLDHEEVSAISGTDESRKELLAAIRDLYDEERESLGVLALELSLVPGGPAGGSGGPPPADSG